MCVCVCACEAFCRQWCPHLKIAARVPLCARQSLLPLSVVTCQRSEQRIHRQGVALDNAKVRSGFRLDVEALHVKQVSGHTTLTHGQPRFLKDSIWSWPARMPCCICGEWAYAPVWDAVSIYDDRAVHAAANGYVRGNHVWLAYHVHCWHAVQSNRRTLARIREARGQLAAVPKLRHDG